MFEALGNHAEGEGLHARDRFITVGAIAHDPGQCRYFGQPPAIIFALKLDGKGHPSTVASGQQSNNRLEPSRQTVGAILSHRRVAQTGALGRQNRGIP